MMKMIFDLLIRVCIAFMQRVVDRVFHEDLAVGAETLDLLDAAIARAEPGRHHYQSHIHVCNLILS